MERGPTLHRARIHSYQAVLKVKWGCSHLLVPHLHVRKYPRSTLLPLTPWGVESEVGPEKDKRLGLTTFECSNMSS